MCLCVYSRTRKTSSLFLLIPSGPDSLSPTSIFPRPSMCFEEIHSNPPLNLSLFYGVISAIQDQRINQIPPVKIRPVFSHSSISSSAHTGEINPLTASAPSLPFSELFPSSPRSVFQEIHTRIQSSLISRCCIHLLMGKCIGMRWKDNML